MDQAVRVGGAASRTLDVVIVRATIVFRCVGCLIVPVAALVESPPPGSGVPRAIALAAVLLWGGVVWLVCRRERRLPAWVVVTDTVFFSVVALNAGALLPARLVGDGTTWVTAPLSASVLLAAWSLAPWQAVALTAAAMAAYVGGPALAGAPLAGGLWVNVAVLPIQLVLGWVIVRYLRRVATGTDRALLHLAETERWRKVFEARSQAAAERRLALHGDVIGVLTAVARGVVAARAKALHDRAIAALAGLVDWGRHGQMVATQTIVDEMRDHASALGITLRYRATRTELPASVAHAVTDALREGLRNIERHAGTDVAELDVAESDGRVTIELRDRGAGFIPPESVGSIGLGESIVGRMASVGGEARVSSTPGQGTTVTLIADRPSLAEANGHRPSPFGSRLPDAYVAAFARVLMLLPAGWHAATLVAFLSNTHNYHSLSVEIAAWLALVAVAVVLAVRSGRSIPPRTSAALLGVTVLAASVASALCRGDTILDKANWAIGDFTWFLVGIATAWHPRWVIVAWPVVPLVTVLTAFVTTDRPVEAAGRLLNILLFAGLLQAGALVVYRVLRQQAIRATEAMHAAHEIETEQAATQAIAEDRAARYRAAESALMPFLRGLADGTVDPADPPVQDEAWMKANMLRALIEHDKAELSAATIDRVVAVASEAAARGVVPHVRLAELESIPDDVAAALTAVMCAVVARAEPPGDAWLTVLADRAGARATVVMPTSVSLDELRRAAGAATPVPLRVDAVALQAGGVWVQARWAARATDDQAGPVALTE